MTRLCIPPELCDYTIDYLHDDPSSLKQCSLTCKSWLPAARYHLFGRVEIHSQYSCDAFYRVLSGAPEIGAIIHQLDISSSILGELMGAKAKARGISPLVMIPPLLLSLLPNVKVLTISALTMKAALHNQWSGGITSVTQLTLHGCFFDSMGQFIDLYHSFPCLETLSLTDTRWKSSKYLHSRDRPVGTTHLRSLSLGKGLAIACLVDWFVEQYACSNLTFLSAYCSSQEDVTALAALITQAAHLEHCEFQWYGFAHDNVIRLPDAFSLVDCTSLKKLYIRCPVMYDQSLPWVTSLLSRAPTQLLERIDLEVRLLGSADAIDWAGITRILSPTMFKSLLSLKLGVILWSSIGTTPRDVESMIRGYLAPLERHGILKMTVL
ncbi:hypothetical protein QCA50_001992 [Cerrena zonata]|uniref:F-box domain-containing protein n=1 Tax=Cerrena zonata TaxID=2478898 RepID=A0AAW0GUL9_9APHY